MVGSIGSYLFCLVSGEIYCRDTGGTGITYTLFQFFSQKMHNSGGDGRHLISSSSVQHERRSSRHFSCWLMIISPLSDETAADKYTLLEGVFWGDVLRIFEALSSQYIVRILPCYMSNVSSAIYRNKIICSCSRSILLKYIGCISTQSDEELFSRFDSEEAFERHCIEVVFCGYIYKAQLAIRADEASLLMEQSASILFTKCKDLAFQKQHRRHTDNRYLGREACEDDLRRCCKCKKVFWS